MINRSDCLILLNELKEKNGIEIEPVVRELFRTKEPTLKIIKFINDHKTLDARLFYEKLRKSYNNHSSKLYLNIVKGDLEPKEILTCLASLNLQILLYNKNVENSTMFLRHMRFDEIQKAMLNYSLTGDIIPCQKLLSLFKLDLKALEEISKKE